MALRPVSARLLIPEPETTPLGFIESPAPHPTRFSPPDPEANCLKTGTLADIPRQPEDAATVNERTSCWYECFSPQNEFHCWLVEQITFTSLKIDHNGRVERRLRDRAVICAKNFWDADRRLDAENLGEKLAKAPARIVNQLQRTPHGCDWLIDRWERLARIADSGLPWDLAQSALAYNLLGIPLDERASCGINLASDPASLARREVVALRKCKEEVTGLDALDRALTEADYVDVPSDQIRQLRRRDAELQRWLKWCLDRIDKKPLHRFTATRVYPYFLKPSRPADEETPLAEVAPVPQASDPEPEPEPSATPEAPHLVIVGEAEGEPEEATEPPARVHPKPVSDRQQEKLNKTEARHEARLRRLDRRRA